MTLGEASGDLLVSPSVAPPLLGGFEEWWSVWEFRVWRFMGDLVREVRDCGYGIGEGWKGREV